MAITHAFTSAVTDSGAAGILSPDDWNADHEGSTEWDVIVVKPSDQDVTNSNTLTDDTALQLSVASGDVWSVRFEIIYAGTDASADYKYAVVVSSGTMHGFYQSVFTYSFNDAAASGSGATRIGDVSATTGLTAGTDGSGGKRIGTFVAYITFSATGTFKWQFAQSTAVSSTAARTCAGSRLLAKQLA